MKMWGHHFPPLQAPQCAFPLLISTQTALLSALLLYPTAYTTPACEDGGHCYLPMGLSVSAM